MTSKENPEANVRNMLTTSHLVMLKRIADKIYYEARKNLNQVDLNTLSTLERAGLIKNSLSGKPDTGNVAFSITEAGKDYVGREMQKINSRFAELAGNQSAVFQKKLTELKVGKTYSNEDIEIHFDMRLNNPKLREILKLCTTWEILPRNEGYRLKNVNLSDVGIKNRETFSDSEPYLRTKLRIMQVLQAAGEPMTAEQIAKNINISTQECKNKLISLRNEQKVRTAAYQKKPGKNPTLWEITDLTKIGLTH